MSREDVLIRLEYKDAKKLHAALAKGVFNKLTKAEADAISDFCFQLTVEVGAEPVVDVSRGRIAL